MDTNTVFELRNEAKLLSGIEKVNKLNNALNISRQLFLEDNSDEWTQKAFAWVLIDLCKYYISENKLNQASVFFNELNTIDFLGHEDDIIEKQKNFLRPKIDINYLEVQKAEVFSKKGKNKEALGIFKNLIFKNRLTELHHESYGWVIYRYIKAEQNNLSSVEVRTFLRDYMNLMNERPSLLHSMILNFALNYTKTHSDFHFYNFFLLWNPDNLRYEDLHDRSKDGNTIPSLISRICKEFVNSNIEINIEEFLDRINLNKETVLDFFREPIFWNIYNAQKENRFSDLWNLFEKYNTNYSKHGQSKWHSEILNLAERFMKENDEWRFLNFFQKWNPINLRENDWNETKIDESTYKPLAIKAIKKAFGILKTQTSEENLSWLIQPYEKAIKLFPDDEWLLREKALLHFKNNELELAIKIYKQLVLELADKYYVWQEFSDCIISENSLKIGMLSKALSLEKNEDFLGDIHLSLAKVLIDEHLLDNAFVELEIYKKHREKKGWKFAPDYRELLKKTGVAEQNLKDNSVLYKKYIPVAENFVYIELDWTEVVLIDKWKDKKGKERLDFTDGKKINFSVGKKHFVVLNQSELGQIFKFKLHKQEIKKETGNKLSGFNKNIITEYKYIPLIAEKTEKQNWEILNDTFAVVDYINKKKNIIHALTTDNKEVFFQQIKNELQIGDFITAKSYIKIVKDKERTELRRIRKIDKEVAISKFQTQIAVVDEVNEQKQLFHFIISSELQGIIKYSDTNLRPNVGDFIKLSFTTKMDNKRKLRVIILNIESTKETNQSLQKDIVGLLQIKYKKTDYFEEDLNFYDEYSTNFEWIEAIKEEYISNTNISPSQQDVDKIFEMIKSIINDGNHYDIEEEITEEYVEKEISDNMFDENGKLLLDKLYPNLFKESEIKPNSSNDGYLEDPLYEIALNVVENNEELHYTLIPNNVKSKIPDFAFIGDYYVPKHLLEKHKITSDCRVNARVIYAEDRMKRPRWKIIEIQKI